MSFKEGSDGTMNIIVYGLGKNGKEFIQEIKEDYENVIIIAITDTYTQALELQSKESMFYIDVSDIFYYKFDCIVITPNKYYDEIKRKLIDLGVQEDKIKLLKEMCEAIGKYYCNLCNSVVLSWKYIGEEQEVFRVKDVIGASRRRGGCPICGSLDRTRYVYYIIKKYTNLLNGSKHKVLHFAPEYMLSEKIRRLCGDEYITADITPGRGDVTADITNLQFGNGSFDYIICNHVMEHVSEEELAFSEIRRCLAAGGILIFTVPICWEEKTYEDKKIVSEEERVIYYGQRDHVRLYGNDIMERIGRFGFHVDMYLCNKAVDENKRRKLGFILKDAVFLCSRM